MQYFPATFFYLFSVNNIDVRLTNGNSSFQGRLEINYKGRWGTVCDDLFSMENANVICRMLGSDKAVEFGTVSNRRGFISDLVRRSDLHRQ